MFPLISTSTQIFMLLFSSSTSVLYDVEVPLLIVWTCKSHNTKLLTSLKLAESSIFKSYMYGVTGSENHCSHTGRKCKVPPDVNMLYEEVTGSESHC